MERSKILLLVVVLLSFSGLLVRDYLPGNDSYFFLANAASVPQGMPPIFFQILGVLPTGFEWVIMPVLALFAAVALAKLSKQDLSGILLFASPAFILHSTLLEDDLLGFPLCMAALYYFYEKKYIYSYIILCIAMFVWRGAVLFVPLIIAQVLINRGYKFIANGLLAAGLLYIFFTNIVGLNVVGESMPGFAILVVGLAGLVVGLNKIKEAPQWLQTMTWWFGGLGFILAKFVWLAAVPFAILTALYVSKHKYKNELVALMLVFGLGYGFFTVSTAPPTNMDDLIDVISITGSDAIANDWTYGHQLTWLGGNPLYTPLEPVKGLIEPQDAEWILSNQTINLTKVKQYEKFALYRT